MSSAAKKVRHLESRIRALGHRLGIAEVDGPTKDLPSQKSEHAKLLKQLYWGREGK